MKTPLPLIIVLLITTPATAQTCYYYGPYIIPWRPAIINNTPAHAGTYKYSNQPTPTTIIRPYGGTNYRPYWTNYKPDDTSWGYKEYNPRAKDVGITAHKKTLTHPNPRSLYRKPSRP